MPERLEFYTDKDYSEEYSWVFPRGEIMNVGLLASGAPLAARVTVSDDMLEIVRKPRSDIPAAACDRLRFPRLF